MLRRMIEKHAVNSATLAACVSNATTTMTTSISHAKTPTSSGDFTVLIPAAGTVPEGVLALSNIGCPAMIPVGGRPVIQWTMRYLLGLGMQRFIIAVPKRGLFIEDFVECVFGHEADIEFIVPEKKTGVGQTVHELAQRVQTSSALVVLGDTHFQFSDPAILAASEPFVLVQPVEESYRWCVVERDARKYVTAMHDKVPNLPGPLEALIGVYGFPDARPFKRATQCAIDTAHRLGQRAELSHILDIVRAEAPILAVSAGDWLDCGNPDRQASSHQTLLQKREFNELRVDPVVGTITKRSRHVAKFIDEINYLRLLPTDLAVLFPRVLDYSVEWERPSLTLEYYGYPTLAEMFVFENIDAGIWERVFLHLREIIVERFMCHRRPILRRAIRDMYVEKTRQRLENAREMPGIGELIAHDGPILVNGRPLRNLPMVWPQIDAAIEQLAETAVATVIHGDLCFSNVLYDLRSRICKFIDPRGSFGTAGIFGDPRYDVAKLFHSVHGLYDFITNDLFRLSGNGPELTLDVRVSPNHRRIAQRFEQVFFPTFDRREILLVTGLLFASMIALHYDFPLRQRAMYAIALQLLDDYFSDGPPTS